jgi:FAD/FMN-containing dehydrogenase
MATPDDLRAAIAGRLLTPDDEGYDEARRVHNGMIDKRPALIARCLDVSDIVAAVGYARDEGLQFSVRGGGHNVGGRGVLVDPERRVAVAQGGATWGDFYRATDIYGLSTNGGVISSTGVAGLTLGGGTRRTSSTSTKTSCRSGSAGGSTGAPRRQSNAV